MFIKNQKEAINRSQKNHFQKKLNNSVAEIIKSFYN